MTAIINAPTEVAAIRGFLFRARPTQRPKICDESMKTSFAKTLRPEIISRSRRGARRVSDED